jgi:hypothetical protein
MRTASRTRASLLRRSAPGAALAALLLVLALGAAQARSQGEAAPMPEFADRSPRAWINSAPLSRADLAGKVVLIEVWNTT